ncbi:MAG: HAMP domain-containing sensor histidine kinase [Spirochaetales bacterium]
MKILMSKLLKKFLISIFLVFLLVIALSVFINQLILEKYFIKTQTNDLITISEHILANSIYAYRDIKEIEDTQGVTVLIIETKHNIDIVNKDIRNQLFQKGIILDKYWLWDGDFKKITSGQSVSKIYPQIDLQYDFLAKYTLYGDDILIVSKILPVNSNLLTFASISTTIILILTGCLLFCIIAFLVRRITKSIENIRKATQAIANSDYQTVTINTDDELNLLAVDINTMSLNLQQTHKELENTNNQMKELLCNVSHELKTPISLIKMYSCGIRDNLDDGTFLEIIIAQNNKMSEIVETLLLILQNESRALPVTSINIGETLENLLQEFKVYDITFNTNIEKELMTEINKDVLCQLLSNVISNGIKYSFDKIVDIILVKNHDNILLCISNKISQEITDIIDTEKIWDAFYVAEKSRNANLTGTGLGLSLVKALCEENNISYSCTIKHNKIIFTFDFVKSMSHK